MAKCYILASISNILQTKHQNLETSTEIMDSLQEMFGRNTRSARQAALKGIMNCKMGKGTRVRDHVLKIMDYLNEAEIQGAQIDDNSKIDMVLESLPKKFKEFKVNYNMNKRNMTLTELMNELHSAEEIYCTEKSLGSIKIANKVLLLGPSRKARVRRKLGKRNRLPSKMASRKANASSVDRKETRKISEGSVKLQYGYVYLMRHKSKTLEKFKEYRAETEKQLGLSTPVIEQEEEQQLADQHRIIPKQPSLLEPRRSGRVSRLPARYMLLGETYTTISDEHVQDPTGYNEALINRDVEFWKKAINQEMESMYSNKVWELVEAPNEVKPIGCKWIYKRKRGVDGRVETFKVRLVAKGFTQKEGIDYEETFSPIAMLKSIRILLPIAAVLDYEIWQMDVKIAFLNGHLEEDIYMQQLDGFIQKGQEHMVYKLQRSIYGLKQASRSWNARFDQAIKSFGFIQNIDEPCVYKKIQEKSVAFLILYVEDILLIGNDIGVLTTIKSWKIKTLALSQAVFIDKILARFSMENSKTGLLPFRHEITFSKDQSAKTYEEIEKMRRVPCAEVVGSLMYAVLCTRPDICFAVGMVSKYQCNPRPEHLTAVKHIIKYLKRTKNYMLVYSGDELIPVSYTDSDFLLDKDFRKSTSGYVFTLGSGAISWRSVKQSCIADSTTEAEYVAASEALNLRNHKKQKHIERKYHLIRDIVQRGDVEVTQIASQQNLADPFTKAIPGKPFNLHLESMSMRFIDTSFDKLHLHSNVICVQPCLIDTLLINCASVMKNVFSEQHQRGAANGLAMTVVSLTKTAGPAVGGALFSWSQKRQDAGFLPGMMIY
ncbi:hypothetical protein KPL71_014762 [Citrus sinensis]|uniref:Uncharacterized protein n=1 Tax=Citrus sinensis TaxID=2711 RepID=A0ACB8KE18_CITSI|nr:hypothetical protein KPL71_014762 [Citrus sinensis]